MGESVMPEHPCSLRAGGFRGDGTPQSQARGLKWPHPAKDLAAASTCRDPGQARGSSNKHRWVFQSINRGL